MTEHRIVEIIIDSRRHYIPESWIGHIEGLVRLIEASEPNLHMPVKLVSFNYERKIAIIKELRTILGLSLKDAKDAADRVQAGVPLEIGIFPWDTANNIKMQLEAAGGRAKIPSPLELLAREDEGKRAEQ